MGNKIQTLLRKSRDQYSETKRNITCVFNHFLQYKARVEETRKAMEFDLNQVVEPASGIWEWLKSLNLEGTDFCAYSFLEGNSRRMSDSWVADLNETASRGIGINREYGEGKVRLDYPIITGKDFNITSDSFRTKSVFLNPRGLAHNVRLFYPEENKNRFSFDICNPKGISNPVTRGGHNGYGLDTIIEKLIEDQQYLAKASSRGENLDSLHRDIENWMDELGELKSKVIRNLSVRIKGPKDDEITFTIGAFVEHGKEYFMQQVEKFIELTTVGY